MSKSEMTAEQAAAKQARKAEKKARKAAAAESNTSTAAGTTPEVDTAATADAGEKPEDEKARLKREKKEAKKAEKKRKRENDDATPATSAAASGTSTPAAAPVPDQPTVEGERTAKKAKKSKKAGGDDASAPASAPVASTSTAPAPAPAEVEAFLAENNISYEPASTSTALPPVLSFAALPLDDGVRKGLSGFSKPTPIQSASFPLMLAGRDVVGIAETGSVSLCLNGSARREKLALTRTFATVPARRSRSECPRSSTSSPSAPLPLPRAATRRASRLAAPPSPS